MQYSLTIIAPLYNEAENIQALYQAIKKVWEKELEKLSNYLIFIDDGSTDNTFEVAQKIAEKDKRVIVLKFTNNFGHHVAITAGLEYAKSDFCVIMDSDLQDQPSDIPKLLELISVEKPLVYTIRKSKKGSIFKQFTSSFFWKWIRFASGLDIPKDQAMLRLFDKKVLKSIQAYPKTVPFYGGIFAHLGYKYATLAVAQSPRNEGESKYNFKRLFALFSVATFGFGFQLVKYLKLLMIIIGFFSPILLLQSIYNLLWILPILIVLGLLHFKCQKMQSSKEPISYKIDVILNGR